MEKFLINGGRKLNGSIKIESAKNAVLPILAGSILTEEEVVIKNCPKIKDVLNMVEILNGLGVYAEFYGNDIVVNSKNIFGYEIPEKLMCKLRSSIFMMGALLSRMKKAVLYYPGGCDIGDRPIDIHLNGLKSMGAFISEVNGEIVCSGGSMKSSKIKLPFPSVGATENLMLSAVKLKGRTVIENVAREPEIKDLAKFLNLMGAKIKGAGGNTIVIDGVKKLHGVEYQPISDRIEAGTYIIASAITGGDVEIVNVNYENIYPLLDKFCNNTCKVSVNNDIIHIKGVEGRKGYKLITGPYPEFPTDLQAPAMALATVSEGVSEITETVFEKRFKQVEELVKMGANIKVVGNTATIEGVKRLKGTKVFAKDLRGGASLVIAGLVADGKTVVSGVEYIDRGYFKMEEKLKMLGADIKRKK